MTGFNSGPASCVSHEYKSGAPPMIDEIADKIVNKKLT